MPSGIVVVGAGPAGVAAALAAGRLQHAGEVVLLGAEQRYPYERPPLSKAVVAGTAQPEAQPIVKADILAASRVKFIGGVTVASIDRIGRTVRFNDGRHLSYQTLVLATGAKARILAALPLDMRRVFYLRTADDALALRASLQTSSRNLPAVIVGAGLIGLEVAASISWPKTLILEVGKSAMARTFSPDLAQIVVDRHQRQGVHFRFGTTIVSASPSEDRIFLKLNDGTSVEAAAVIVGAGGEPNVDIAAAAGLEVNDGILVDEYCRTSDPRIFAAGDVARFECRWSPKPERLENWRHALDQGQVAGANAAGGDAVYSSIPSFWSDQYELQIHGVGWLDGLSSPPVRRTVGDGRLIDFHLRDGCVRYAVSIGMPRESGIARRLIERQMPVMPQMLTDEAVSLQALLRS